MNLKEAEKLVSKNVLQQWINRGKLKVTDGEIDEASLRKLLKFNYIPKDKWFTNREGEIIRFWSDNCSDNQLLCVRCSKRIECEALYEKLSRKIYSRD